MLRVNTRVETQGDRTGGEERLNTQQKKPKTSEQIAKSDQVVRDTVMKRELNLLLHGSGCLLQAGTGHGLPGRA